MSDLRVAGLSMKGGRKDNFFFCLIDHHEESNRWFLKSLLQFEDDEDVEDSDDAIRSWLERFQVNNLIIDFPLSRPPCQECLLSCPGISKCPVEDVKFVNKELKNLLTKDAEFEKNNPKQYERERNRDDLFDHSKDIFKKWPIEGMLSRPFKRKLKKGFLPYWNRPIDFWIWCYYHDQILSLFNTTYDSFGNTSLMMLSRFSYMRRHFPNELNMFEGNINLTLIELIRSKILLKKNVTEMADLDLGVEARLDIIKKVENKLNIFIYDHDLEVIVKNPRAFDSFLLAIAGQRKLLDSAREIPDWASPEGCAFIAPKF